MLSIDGSDSQRRSEYVSITKLHVRVHSFKFKLQVFVQWTPSLCSNCKQFGKTVPIKSTFEHWQHWAMKMDFGEQDGCRRLWLLVLFGEGK